MFQDINSIQHSKRSARHSGKKKEYTFHRAAKVFPLIVVYAFSYTMKASAFVPIVGRRSQQTLVRRASTTRAETETSSIKETGLILPSHPDRVLKSVMAPMVAASDFPFRYFLHKHCGVDLTYTQMLHARNFVHDPVFRKTHLDLWEAGVSYPKLMPTQVECLGGLDEPQGVAETDSLSPNIVQLAGNDVDLVVQAANMILEHTDGKVSGFDLNCGCPQAIARKGDYGAFLMERDVDLVCSILSALRKSLPSSTSVSAKIRLPVDDDVLKERISQLMGTGINYLTIHGRTLKENKTKVGPCHVDRIRLAVETAHKIDPEFPIVANGGMEFYEDVQDILDSTGCVAAMSSEALLETPNIFLKSSKDLSSRELLDQQIRFSREYLNVCSTVMPPVPGVLGMGKNKGGSFSIIRAHLFKFLHRYFNEHPDIRDKLASNEKDYLSIPSALNLIDELEGRYAQLSDEELAGLKSSSPEASWYRRHRKSGRRVHQKDGKGEAPKIQTVEERKQEIRERLERMKAKKTSGKTKSFV